MTKLTTYICRGKITESTHEAKFLVKNYQYKTIFSSNNDKDLIYPRSSIKVFQAIPFINSEAHKKFKLSEKEIAMACASHCGEEEHLKVLNQWIKKLKINKKHLKCGIHNPLNHNSSNKLLLSGEKPNQLHNNCAGKHLAMLSGCLINKNNILNYVNFNHPYQKLIRDSLETFTEKKILKKQIGVDGCSAPQYAFPMKNLSIAMINLIKKISSNNKNSTNIKILINSIIKYPHLIGGTDRYDSELMNITKGKIFAKGGAEGVLLFAHLHKKIGGIIKIKDGNERALPSAANKILTKLSLISNTESKKLLKWSNQTIYNHAKIKVGNIYSKLN